MEKDLLLKRYLCDNDRFADLLNGIVGEQLVEPENLTELDTQTGVFSVLRNRFGRNKRQGYRDLLKKAAFGINFLVVGIENQELVQYLMPLRCMSYDAGEYERQAAHIRKRVRKMPGITSAEFLSGFTKESKLNPCITLVLYFGEDWDGPRKLSDIIDFTEIPEKFRQLVTEDSAYEALDEDAYDVIAEYTNVKGLKEIKDVSKRKEGGKVDMCYAMEVLLREQREIGIQTLCETCREFGILDREVVKKIAKKLEISKEQIWNELVAESIILQDHVDGIRFNGFADSIMLRTDPHNHPSRYQRQRHRA